MERRTNRCLCWDTKLIEEERDLFLLAHKPQKKNIALLCDDEWEGVHNSYGCTVRVGDTIRRYYRRFQFFHIFPQFPRYSPVFFNLLI